MMAAVFLGALAFWIVGVILVGLFAETRGRSPVLAMLSALIVSPLVAGLAYGIAGRTTASRAALTEADELVRIAVRARHAASDTTTQPSAPAPSPGPGRSRREPRWPD